MSESAPAWETSKENVLPIKRGRSAKGLNDALTKSSIQQEQEVASRESAFESQIQACGPSQPVLLLDIYVQYIKWAKDAFPTSPNKIHQLLERCTVELKDCKDLKNDARLVTLWIEYADLVRTPGEIFTYMNTEHVGEKLALFWIAWAYVAEKAQNYKLADQIFGKGTRRKAEPEDALNKRYKQFQRRMARQYLNGESEDYSESGSSVSSGVITDEVIATAMNAIRSAPSASTTTAASSTTAAASAGAPKRRALSAIDESGAPGIASTAAPVAREQPSAVRPSSHSQGASQGHPPTFAAGASTSNRARPVAGAPQSRPTAAGKSGAGNQAASFEIFSDFAAPSTTAVPAATTSRGAAIAAVAPHLYEPHLDDANEQTAAGAEFAPTWGNLGTEASRRKENDGPVTKWSQGPLPGAAGVPTSATSSLIPSIPIFVDPEFAVDTTAEKLTATARLGAPQDLGNVLSVRRKLDAMESMARNPLARHTATSSAAAPSTSAGASADIPATRVAPTKAPETAIPVPAKLSLRPPELPVFTSAAPPAPSVLAPAVAVNHARSPVPPHKSTRAETKGAPAAASAPFSIFCDEPSVAVAVAAASVPAKAVRGVSSPRAAAFSVYEGGNSPLPPPTVSRRAGRGLSTTTAPVTTTAVAAAPAFSIFEDDALPGNNDTALPVKAPAASFTLYESPPKHDPQPVSKATVSAPAPAFSLYESPPQAVVQKQPVLKTAAAFDIYTDEPLAQPASAPASAPAASTAGGFDIYVDEPSFTIAQPAIAAAPASVPVLTGAATSQPVPAAPESSIEEQDRELHAILDGMMALDNEDGTINTRLARRDIDMMFCSPTIHRAPPAPSTRMVAPSTCGTSTRPAMVSDENSFCGLPTAGREERGFERSLFRAYSDEAEGGSDGDEDHCGAGFGAAPRARTGRQGGMPLHDSSAGGAAGGSGGSAGDAGMREAVPGVLHRAAHRPFGVQLDTGTPFSAAKDLSAIKESSQEFSLCGMLLETPGHTNTHGYGGFGGFNQRAPAAGGNTGTAGAHRDRGSYSQCGNMLADISDFACSRDSFGSVIGNAAPVAYSSTTNTNNANANTSAMGFEIFIDAPAVGAAPPSTAGKRRVLAQHPDDTYYGV